MSLLARHAAVHPPRPSAAAGGVGLGPRATAERLPFSLGRVGPGAALAGGLLLVLLWDPRLFRRPGVW